MGASGKASPDRSSHRGQATVHAQGRRSIDGQRNSSGREAAVEKVSDEKYRSMRSAAGVVSPTLRSCRSREPGTQELNLRRLHFSTNGQLYMT